MSPQKGGNLNLPIPDKIGGTPQPATTSPSCMNQVSSQREKLMGFVDGRIAISPGAEAKAVRERSCSLRKAA